MANQENQPAGGSAKKSNPIAHVAYQAVDLSGVESAGGGSTQFVPVTAALRAHLKVDVSEVEKVLTAEAVAQPEIPGVMVIRLRNEAIAKSHRPLDLIRAASIEQAGHGEINEMLVTVTPRSLAQLRDALGTRDTKKLRANISTIEGFEAWDASRRLPRVFRNMQRGEAFRALKKLGHRLLVRLFVHASAKTSNLIIDRLEGLLTRLQITGFKLDQQSGAPVYALDMNEALTEEAFIELIKFQGVRTIRPEPRVHAAAATTSAAATSFSSAPPPTGLPIVAVFDTGADPAAKMLTPWIVSHDTYVLPPDTNYVHGTAVSSLVADSSGMNDLHPHFPTLGCVVHDVCALESGIAGSYQTDLILRLRAALAKRSDIKVWNLSLGGQEVSDDEFSDFGRELDSLSDLYGVLFIVAAGNYLAHPRRGWPVNGGPYDDRLSSPGDSVRSLTIGAITHLDSPSSMVRANEPASYSRRGPGPVFTPKPDIVHIGGNTDANFDCDMIGVNVLKKDGLLPRGFGTSYAAPLAAAMAAHTWQALVLPGRPYEVAVSPTMVKLLMIHSAQLNSPERSAVERRYYGSGLPGDPTAVLYDADDSFTMLFELDIVDTTKWRKTHFPIPTSLLHEGKLRAEVIITAAYAPPLNSDAGAEYVRFNVDVGFGTLSHNDKGGYHFKGCVPSMGELGTTGLESAQVEHGGKWSPVKTYRRRFPRGAKGNLWGLQATILRRSLEPMLIKPLRVVIAVTLRALDGNPGVYAEGRRLLAQNNWISQNLSQRVDVQVNI
jgi:serine protease AprX